MSSVTMRRGKLLKEEEEELRGVEVRSSEKKEGKRSYRKR